MFFYRLLSIILLPVIYLYLIIRLSRGKEDCKRFKERFGFSSKKKLDGELIWIHCVSVGESNSSIALIEEILKTNSSVHILLTSTTVTSASQIKQKLTSNSRIIHQFLPIDDFFSSSRFIKHWKPNLAIFVESEIWPNLIDVAAKNKVKLALINARISLKSAKRWQLFHKIGFNVLKNFQITFAQSKKDQEKLINLGLTHTKFIGNLKSLAKTLEFDDKKLKNLSNQIKDRPFWLAASTHEGEEEIIIKLHQKLKKSLPNLLTIIAPRHPNRINNIIKLIPNNLNFAIRSKNEKMTSNIDIYIADTLGELGLFYKLTDVTLICGSLKENIGGHNPFEALKLNCAIISGCYVDNFEEIYQDLEKNKACIIIKNEEELFSNLLQTLKNKESQNDLKQNWQKLNKSNDNILNEILVELKIIACKK